MSQKKGLLIVFILALMIVTILCRSTFYINFWPSDEHGPYLPTARILFSLPYLSKMHDIQSGLFTQLNMRGKEALILGFAGMQKVFQDDQSLFPLVFLLIIALGICSVMIYAIFARGFDSWTGLLLFFLFISSVWPYLYVLQASHPLLAMMNFLCSLFCLQLTRARRGFYFPAGLFLGLLVFSSPTAALYIPYFLLLFLFSSGEKYVFDRWGGVAFFLMAAGVLAVFTFPDPLHSLQEFIKFLAMNKNNNHFYADQERILGSLPTDVVNGVIPYYRGGGWEWIVKYLFLINPVITVLAVVSAAYVVWVQMLKRSLLFIVIVGVGFSTIWAVETIGSAQFGRNYFSVLIGFLFLIGWAFFDFRANHWPSFSGRGRNICRLAFGMVLAGHLVYNAFVFFGDVYPSRMMTTMVYRWLQRNHISELYILRQHEANHVSVDFLNNPKVKTKIHFHEVDSIAEVEKGYVLIPPMSERMIWFNCSRAPVWEDPYLSRLLGERGFPRYAVARFRSLGSSRIWSQEEEICTYLDLIKNRISKTDREKAMLYILDAEKLHKDGY